MVTVINPLIMKDLTLPMPSKYNQLHFTLVMKSKLHLHNYILCWNVIDKFMLSFISIKGIHIRYPQGLVKRIKKQQPKTISTRWAPYLLLGAAGRLFLHYNSGVLSAAFFFLPLFLHQLPLLTLNGPLLHVLFSSWRWGRSGCEYIFHTPMEEICQRSPATIEYLVFVGPLKGRLETFILKL